MNNKKKKKNMRGKASKSLAIVHVFFPWVQTIVDSDDPCLVEVTQGDVNIAKVKSHKTCALAVACQRSFHADGVIIARTTAYVIKGIKATRYRLGSSIGMEQTAFDRGAYFAKGTYQLSSISPANKLGTQRSYDPDRRGTRNGKFRKRFIHFTEGVRTALSKLPAEKMLKTELTKLSKKLKG